MVSNISSSLVPLVFMLLMSFYIGIFSIGSFLKMVLVLDVTNSVGVINSNTPSLNVNVSSPTKNVAVSMPRNAKLTVLELLAITVMVLIPSSIGDANLVAKSLNPVTKTKSILNSLSKYGSKIGNYPIVVNN